MIFGGLLAGGVGSRMASAQMPKQFLPVAGIPVFMRTLKVFLSVDAIDKVIVSINMDWKEKYEQLLKEYSIDQQRVILTPGGESRFSSLKNITQRAYMECSDKQSIIITYDCARMFVSKRILADNISHIERFDMVTTALPTIVILHSRFRPLRISNCWYALLPVVLFLRFCM